MRCKTQRQIGLDTRNSSGQQRGLCGFKRLGVFFFVGFFFEIEIFIMLYSLRRKNTSYFSVEQVLDKTVQQPRGDTDSTGERERERWRRRYREREDRTASRFMIL